MPLDYSWSGAARWSPALSISAPIFFETFGACPVVNSSFRGTAPTSVAASGTVATGGLSAVLLYNPVGAFIGSCDGSFCAATLAVTSNATAATQSDCFGMIFLLTAEFLRAPNTNGANRVRFQDIRDAMKVTFSMWPSTVPKPRCRSIEKSLAS